MKLIFSADLNWGIGCNNRLLFHKKADMKFFRDKTTGKVVIMGRKTLETLPNAKPLQNRTNIVLTADERFSCDGAIICHSIEELFEEAKAYATDDLLVIGGELIYKQLLNYCDTAYITRFYKEAEADRFMPDFDELEGWSKTEESEEFFEDDIRFKFFTYKNSNVQVF